MSIVVTITEPVQGVCDDAQGGPDPQPPTGFVVQPGTYDVEQVDAGDLWLIVDDVPDACVIVSYQAIGFVDCNHCEGRGEYTYLVAQDEWESDRCESCSGLGGVTPETAAAQEDEREAALRADLEHEGVWHP